MAWEDRFNTFILMWNPEISSFSSEDWKRIMARYPFETFNWSVWEHEKVGWCDRCYMVRVGSGNTGVVMHGNFTSEPQKGEDWSGKGRDTYYCDINPWNMLDSDAQPIITTEELQKAIPSFDWTGGHSGCMLTKEEAKKLDKLWDKYCKNNSEFIETQKRQFTFCIDKSVASRIEGFEHLIDYFKHDWADDYAKNPDCVFMEEYYGDTCNLGFDHDYDSSTFHLKYMLQGSVLPITCKNLHRLKMKMDDDSDYTDWFKITSAWEDCFLLEANGIKLICDEISFGEITDYTEDSYPVNI